MRNLTLAAAFLILALTFAGCSVRKPESIEEPVNIQPAEEGPTEARSETTEYKVYIYFGDSQAMNFNKEERIIETLTPERLIEELIKGPDQEENIQTIPNETKLINISIEDKTAYVNFSREIIDNHWGGSSGETMTIGSIVNTLTLNNGTGIERVQILIEGEKVETLAGHIDISIPLEPSVNDTIN